MSTFGQVAEYNMSDTTVTDCIGVLYDSGGLGSIYENNEDFTFTVETEGIISINFTSEFCLDNGFDFLSVYDGPDSGSPLLGTFTGTTIPGSLSASSGSVTFTFTSDENAAYCGWVIAWSTEVTPPEDPIFTFENPSCGPELTLIFDLALEIPIWTMEEAEIIVTGTFEHEIDDINITGTEFVTEVELIFDDPLDYNCDYSVELDIYLPDQCDSLWHFIITEEFLIDDCPFSGSITAANDSICEGECLELLLDFPSGSCFEYLYSWNNGLPSTAGPHEVCPDITTTYSVEITELGTGNVYIQNFTVTVTAGTTDQEDVILCATGESIELLIDDLGAYWFGDGIVDEFNGVFNPDSASVGNNTVYYQASSVCVDSIIVQVLPIDAGNVIAACPGTDPFMLDPFPSGGIWSGPNVTVDGLYDPTLEGSFELEYNLNGCLDTLTVNVEELVTGLDLGIRCQSDPEEQLIFEPFGGIWWGQGIIDSLNGVFDPGEMAGGMNQFYYEIIGCDQYVDIEILPINVGTRSRNSCPDQDPYTPYSSWSPTGGYWEGEGIIDDLNFIYDPGSIPDNYWTELVYFAPNGCTDTIFMYNRYTELGPDTMRFCVEDEDYYLDYETIGRTPWGGSYSGGSFYYIEDDGDYFSPSATGVGEHMITYSNNGCSDSLLMIIYPTQLPVDSMSFCSVDEPITLFAGIPGGAIWSGPGITDPIQGVFDPTIPDDDDFWIYWNTGTDCTDSVFIYIEEYLQAEISDVDPIYCFQDFDFEIGLYPNDGILTGISSENYFNPADEGEGSFFLNYQYTTALCSSFDTMTVFVYPEINGQLSSLDYILCPDESTVLTVISEGGAPGELYTYEWSEGLFPIDQNTIIPEGTTTYYVSVSDGCSDPLIDSVLIEVLPAIEINLTMNDTVCFGLDGFATADVLNEGEYELAWGFNQDIYEDTLYTTAGFSTALLVTDQENGCTFDTIVFTPSYTPIVALFSVNPNEDCIPGEANPVTFIDLSEYGLTGYWDFGNDEIMDYNPDQNPEVTFEAGAYPIYLYIENEGGCPDSTSIDICVLPASRLFIPDIFSPNDDLNNDVLYVRGQGVVNFLFQIYDRWGELVFESTDIDDGWDGKKGSKDMPQSVYVYKLNVELNDGERLTLTGDIVLVR